MPVVSRHVAPTLIIVAALVSACDPGPKKPTLNYHWGAYEGLIYDMYANPGEATPAVQVEKLAAQIEQTKSRGEPVPPGVPQHRNDEPVPSRCSRRPTKLSIGQKGGGGTRSGLEKHRFPSCSD